eukprot:EG_transcript_18268
MNEEEAAAQFDAPHLKAAGIKSGAAVETASDWATLDVGMDGKTTGRGRGAYNNVRSGGRPFQPATGATPGGNLPPGAGAVLEAPCPRLAERRKGGGATDPPSGFKATSTE